MTVSGLSTRAEFEEAAASIASSETARHALILHGLIRWLRPQTVVEVGSWLGYCTAWMARALQENGEGRLVLIDKFERSDTSPDLLRTHLRHVGVEDVVTMIRGDSRDVSWPEHSFAFIDGNHTLKNCTLDVLQAVARGASCIVVHDTTNWWGPREWVESLRQSNHYGWDLLEVAFDSGLTILMRRPEKPDVTFSAQSHPLGYGT